jgi:hypothetical protein
MEDTWVFVTDAAKAENVTTQTVEKWVSAGKIPSRLDSQGRRQVRLGARADEFDAAPNSPSPDGKLEFLPTAAAGAPRPEAASHKPHPPAAGPKGLAAWLTLAVLFVGAGAAGWWAMDTAADAKQQITSARITTAGAASRLWDTLHALRTQQARADGLAGELEQERDHRARLQAELHRAASDLAAAQRRAAGLQAELDKHR